MKRLFFVIIAVVCLTGVLWAWQYSALTTWNGSNHVAHETVFTPGSTSGTMSVCSKPWTGTPTCEIGGWWYRSVNTTKKQDGSLEFMVDIPCGGNSYGTVTNQFTTNEQWVVKAWIDQQAGQTQYQAQGPVKAWTANPKVTCPSEGPEGE